MLGAGVRGQTAHASAWSALVVKGRDVTAAGTDICVGVRGQAGAVVTSALCRVRDRSLIPLPFFSPEHVVEHQALFQVLSKQWRARQTQLLPSGS